MEASADTPSSIAHTIPYEAPGEDTEHDDDNEVVQRVTEDQSDRALGIDEEEEFDDPLPWDEEDEEEDGERLGHPAETPLPTPHRDVIEKLCRRTGTSDIKDLVVEGLWWILLEQQDSAVWSSGIVSGQESEYAVHVFAWLLVLFRHRTGMIHPGTSLVDRCGTHFHAGMKILGIKAQSEFRNAMLSTERDLSQMRIWDRVWYRDIQRKIDDSHVDLDEHANRYLLTFEYFGRAALADELVRAESEATFDGPASPLRDLMREPDGAKWVRSEVDKILFTVSDDLIRGCITRQIASMSHQKHHPIKKDLKVHNKLAAQYPCHYINILCDRLGNPLTANQCRLVAGHIEQYLESGENSINLALKIDRALLAVTNPWPEQLTRSGLRRYADYKQVQGTNIRAKVPQRRQRIADFIRHLRELLNSVRDEDSDKPLRAPLVEVGFSDKVIESLPQHTDHRSANYLSNPFHAATEVRFPQAFTLHQEALYLCTDPNQTWLGEMVFRRLCNGYIHRAGGFSHCAAGHSIDHSYKERMDSDWDTLSLTLHEINESLVDANIRSENEITERLGLQTTDSVASLQPVSRMVHFTAMATLMDGRVLWEVEE